MFKSTGWPLRTVVEEVRTREGETRERLECGHVLTHHSKLMKLYTAQRRRCKACADLQADITIAEKVTVPATR